VLEKLLKDFPKMPLHIIEDEEKRREREHERPRVYAPEPDPYIEEREKGSYVPERRNVKVDYSI